jgi:hypothetical protein
MNADPTMVARRIFVSVILLLTFAARLGAQVGAGEVRGRVVAAADGAPVSYALVRLVPAAAGMPVRSALTDASGAFGFIAVVPGTYRLRLERIGVEAEETEAFGVAAGGTVERVIRSAPRAVSIPGIVASAECRSADNLAGDAALSALWNEAVKGMELRRAFDDAYHYEFDLAQYTTATLRNNGALDSMKRHVVMDPHSRPDRNRSGWGQVSRMRMTLELPDGREILDPAFLRLHCVDGGVDEAAGVYTLGFRPRTARRGRVDIRGEVRLDRTTLQVVSVEVEWTDATRTLLEATVEFGEAQVPGGTVRLPVGGVFSGHPPASMRMGEVRGQIQYLNYSELRKIDG